MGLNAFLAGSPFTLERMRSRIALSCAAALAAAAISACGASSPGALSGGGNHAAQTAQTAKPTPKSEIRIDTRTMPRNRLTFPSVAPLNGQTVGVGMPIIVHFDVPVRNRRNFEKHMTVTSQPAQPGAWHWISSTEVHWRPQTYWKGHSRVAVTLDLGGLPAGGGIYGQVSRTIHFTTGDVHIYRVNTRTDKMRVWSNGKLIRTIPITTGKQGFETRSGVKVIEQKYASIAMNSSSIGIDPGNPEYYNLPAVLWAMRLTNSGEFIHAAPWSTSQQGFANVSHGCTGMSTANAQWLFNLSRVGDVVEYTPLTARRMTLTNGFGDWNLSWKEWIAGSALGATTGTASSPSATPTAPGL